jgi:hypothetical protein
MKTLLKLIGYCLLVLFALSLLAGIGSLFSGDPSEAVAESTESTPAMVDEGTPAINMEELKAELEKDKAALAKVKKSFTFKEDEFNGSGWYHHKLWGRHFLNRNGLTTSVNKEGYIYLSSNYHADDWIFHDAIQVKVGDDVYTSEIIPTYDDSHITDNSGGSVWEIIQFTNDRDNGILKAIADSPTKVVKVRFVGDQYLKDFTLSKGDKLAIAECKRLSDLIKSIEEKTTAITSIK